MNDLDRVIADLGRYPASEEHVEIFHELGYTAHLVNVVEENPGVPAYLSPNRLRLEVVRRTDPRDWPTMVTHELRHSWQHFSGGLELSDRVEAELMAGAILLLEADAITFQVHVADEMRRMGDASVWDRLAAHRIMAPFMATYEEAVSQGRGRAEACSWVFRDLVGYASLREACERQAVAAAPDPDNLAQAGAFDQLVALLRESGPSGEPHCDHAFDEAIHEARMACEGIASGLGPGAKPGPR